MNSAGKIKLMLKRAVVRILDAIDPPPPPPARECPSCGAGLDGRSLVERGDVDYCVCKSCGEASVWKDYVLIAGEESVMLPEEDE